MTERVVTEREVGILATRITRRRAERLAAELNRRTGPVEYHVRRRRPFRWLVVGHQVLLRS